MGKDYIITGHLKIELNTGLNILLYSDGYSVNDLKEQSPKQNFKDPKPLSEYLKDESIIQDIKNCNYTVNDDIFQNIKDINDDIILKTTEIIKKSFSSQSLVKNIEIYEPPLGFRSEWDEGKLKHRVVINEDKAIRLPISSTEIFSSSCIRFMENASYYIILNTSNNTESNYDLRLSSGIDEGYLMPYKKIEGGWTINFGNQLFYGNIEIIDKTKSKPLIKLPVLVYPNKVNPQEVEIIVRQILEWHAELLYDLEPTGLTILPGEHAKKNPIQRLKFIRYLFKKRKLKGILNSIIENPDKILIREDLLKEIQDVETPCCHLLPELVTVESALKRNSNSPHFWNNDKTQGYSFIKAYEEFSRVTHDTYPNRFVKFFLKILKKELNIIEEELSRQDTDALRKYYNWLMEEVDLEFKLSEMKREISRILNRDFFKEVADIKFISTLSQTLLKKYRYQQIFSAYLDLIKGVMLSDKLDELLQDPIRNMPELYEYWCFLKLWKILKNDRKTTPNIKCIKKGIGETLEYNISILFENEDKKLELIYNKYYSKGKDFYSYSIPLRPDLSLMIENNNYKQLILLDAKYRIDWVSDFKELSNIANKEEMTKKDQKEINKILLDERRGTYKIGDIYKMHTYREAIRQGQNEKINPSWVIALYPGTDKKGILYRDDKHKQESNIEEFIKDVIRNKEIGGVGAIPLKPDVNDDFSKTR